MSRQLVASAAQQARQCASTDRLIVVDSRLIVNQMWVYSSIGNLIKFCRLVAAAAQPVLCVDTRWNQFGLRSCGRSCLCVVATELVCASLLPRWRPFVIQCAQNRMSSDFLVKSRIFIHTVLVSTSWCAGRVLLI